MLIFCIVFGWQEKQEKQKQEYFLLKGITKLQCAYYKL